MIVRHGETVANVEHVYQGQTHGKLNERGIAQAYKLKEALHEQDIDVVFCSDLKRAVDTAEIIIGERDVEIVYDKRLRERFLGELQGKKIDDGTKYCDFGDLDCGGDYDGKCDCDSKCESDCESDCESERESKCESESVCNSLKGPVCNAENDGVREESVREESVGAICIEPIEEMFKRVHTFINDTSEIVEVKGYKNILVVSHGITINVFKAISLGEGVEELKGYKTAVNCSLQVMEFQK